MDIFIFILKTRAEDPLTDNIIQHSPRYVLVDAKHFHNKPNKIKTKKTVNP